MMKYALIGCGRVAPNHIKAAKANGLEIAALCDIKPEKAKALAEKYGLENAAIYDDAKKMIKEIKPELAAIAAISGAHAELCILCAENKVSFIVEKPIAMSMKEADDVIEAAKKNGVTAGVCHQNRFNVAVQELRSAIDGGRFGRLSHGSVNIRWHRGKDYYDQDDWRGKWSLDGGTLMNQCIHGIDLLRWMLGDEIESVYGSTRNRLHSFIEGEDIGVAVVNFKNGVVATVEGTVNMTEDIEETLTVCGENGTVQLGGIAANTVELWKFGDSFTDDDVKAGISEKMKNVYGNGHTSLYADVIGAIEEKREPYVTLEAGRRALELVLAIYKSQKTGEVVKLPLGDFSSADMAGEFGQ